MKQQCHISLVYLTWLILILGVVFYLIRGNYLQAVLWICFIILFVWLYIRYFPSFSRLLGYGSVEDTPANRVVHTEVNIFLYTGIGCPFCPIIKKRLEELKSKMGFQLKEIDITLKPEILISKGIRALPVVEIGTAKLIGNATSEKLAEFIMEHTQPKQSA